MTALSLPAIPIDGGMARYFTEVWKFPVLEPDEEYMLAVRWRDHEDVEAAHKLVTSHLRLVAKIAMRFRGYGLPIADLVSEGSIGLMKAVKKFEPERGFRLATYAMWWIKAAITEYVLRSWSLVKMGTMATQKKLFFSLRRLKSKLSIVDNGELTPAQARALARELAVPEADIVAMNRRLAARDVSLNTPVSEDETVQFQDVIPDDGPSPEAMAMARQEGGLRRRLLADALVILSERERDILVRRRLSEEPVTLDVLGRRYGISRERVRQLENRAFDKVQKAVTEAAVAQGAVVQEV